MRNSQYQEIILDEDDLIDLVMEGRDVTDIKHVTVEPNIDIEKLVHTLEDPGQLLTWTFPEESDIAVPDYHAAAQQHWMMPDQYRDLDIAAHVLGLCKSDAELQRVGQELLLFQERDLFDLLKYLKYLVDVMREHKVIWGVGRGSSVSSYVLYLLGVHRIDSLYYDLDPGQFLR